MSAYQRRSDPYCPLCGIDTVKNGGHLHELISRSALGSKTNLELLPKELHIVLCSECNLGNRKFTPANPLVGHPDSSSGIKCLFKYAIELWGIEAVDKAVSEIREAVNHRLSLDEWVEICRENGYNLSLV